MASNKSSSHNNSCDSAGKLLWDAVCPAFPHASAAFCTISHCSPKPRKTHTQTPGIRFHSTTQHSLLWLFFIIKASSVNAPTMPRVRCPVASVCAMLRRGPCSVSMFHTPWPLATCGRTPVVIPVPPYKIDNKLLSLFGVRPLSAVNSPVQVWLRKLIKGKYLSRVYEGERERGSACVI